MMHEQIRKWSADDLVDRCKRQMSTFESQFTVAEGYGETHATFRVGPSSGASILMNVINEIATPIRGPDPTVYSHFDRSPNACLKKTMLA